MTSLEDGAAERSRCASEAMTGREDGGAAREDEGPERSRLASEAMIGLEDGGAALDEGGAVL